LKILLLNQTFHPDLVSTAQHLSDLALALAESGHQVTVVTGRRGYDNPENQFLPREQWRGVQIIRIGSTGFGKQAKWRRALDFASFLFNCCGRLAFLPRQDVVVALTSPPLISFLGATFTRLRGGRFCYWIMDLNPDEAVAAGWLNPRSPTGRLLEWISRFSLRRASRIIALDHFMHARLLAKGVLPPRLEIIPPWSHDEVVRFDAPGRDQFRKRHGLENRFVVMYSGNHSPCHPLDTVLQAAQRLTSEAITFCFVGGGSEFKRVQAFAREHRSPNIVCLPYQPRAELSGSLSAADAHVVVMGNPFVGIIHPCKLYNILNVASPVLYVGPRPSHITDVLDQLPISYPWAQADHGDVEGVARHIHRLKGKAEGHARVPPSALVESFSRETLLPRLVEVVTSAEEFQRA
jgi:glycosyltransferase involved in cell wall biosynthesis